MEEKKKVKILEDRVKALTGRSPSSSPSPMPNPISASSASLNVQSIPVNNENVEENQKKSEVTARYYY